MNIFIWIGISIFSLIGLIGIYYAVTEAIDRLIDSYLYDSRYNYYSLLSIYLAILGLALIIIGGIVTIIN